MLSEAVAWPKNDLLNFCKSLDSPDINSDDVKKYLGSDHVTLLDKAEADSLVVARYLREHPDGFSSFVAFNNREGSTWRFWTWEFLEDFGLPFSALDPFCKALENANSQANYDPHLTRIQEDFPDFPLTSKIPEACLIDDE